MAEIEKLKESVTKLERESKKLSCFEASADKNLRVKTKRVLGFALSNIDDYYRVFNVAKLGFTWQN